MSYAQSSARTLKLLRSKTDTTFTLPQLRNLIREFLDDMETRGHVTTYGPESLTDWKFETFLQWLKTKEAATNGTDDESN